MHNGAPAAIFLCLSSYFVSDRSGVAFTKRDVLQQVRDRIAFAPAKVDVRQFAHLIAQIKQERSNRVRHRRRLSSQNTEAVDTLTAHGKCARKLRSIAWCNFKKQNRLAIGNMIAGPFLMFLLLILECVAGIATISDDANLSLRRLLNKLSRSVVELDAFHAKLS